MIDDIKIKILFMLPGIGKSLMISAAVLTSLYFFEIAMIGWERSSARKLVRGGASIYTDCVSALLVLSNASLLIGTVLSFGLVYIVQRTLKDNTSFNLLTQVPLPWLAYLIFLVTLDFSHYWVHRLMHRVGPLWEIHKFHHSAVEMTMLTALRDHPLERVTIHGFNAIPAAVFGIPPEHYIVLGLALQSLGFLKHSNFHTNWGWIGKWIIQSPSAHRVHHSVATEHYNTNFASIFQCWDVLFGTAHFPSARTSREIAIGIEPAFRSDSTIYVFTQTVRDFYGALFRWARQRPR